MQGRLLVVIHQVRTFEQSLLRVMKGLSRACEFYAKLLLNGVYEFLERLRTLMTATEQAAQTFAEKQAEEYFHPQFRSPSSCLDHSETSGSSEDKGVQSEDVNLVFGFFLRNSTSPYCHSLVNRQGISGNLVKNPTSACTNPVEVITNIETWRVSVQLYKESTGQMPIQEDIKTAFEKLISPVLKNVTGFDWKRTRIVNKPHICPLQQRTIRSTLISHL